VERVRTIQCGPALWTAHVSAPAGAASDAIAELAATSLVPRRRPGLAEPLEGVEVRGLDVAVRWPRSWFLTTDVDAPGGLAGFLQRVVDGRTVGLMRIMVGADEERGAMEEDARAWVASGVTDDAHGEGVVRSRGVGAVALVIALVGPSRRGHAPLWATNRRSLDLILEQARPTGTVTSKTGAPPLAPPSGAFGRAGCPGRAKFPRGNLCLECRSLKSMPCSAGRRSNGAMPVSSPCASKV